MWLGSSITHRRTMGFRRSLRFCLSGANAPTEIWHKNLRGYIYVRRSGYPPCPPGRHGTPYARLCRVPCHTGDQIVSYRGIWGRGVGLFIRCHGGTRAGIELEGVGCLYLVGRLAFLFSSIKVAHVRADVATINTSGIVRADFGDFWNDTQRTNPTPHTIQIGPHDHRRSDEALPNGLRLR